jgi:hypothetical protein
VRGVQQHLAAVRQAASIERRAIRQARPAANAPGGFSNPRALRTVSNPRDGGIRQLMRSRQADGSPPRRAGRLISSAPRSSAIADHRRGLGRDRHHEQRPGLMMPAFERDRAQRRTEASDGRTRST